MHSVDCACKAMWTKRRFQRGPYSLQFDNLLFSPCRGSSTDKNRCEPISLLSTLFTVPFKLVQCALTQNTDFVLHLTLSLLKLFFSYSGWWWSFARFQLVADSALISPILELILCIAPIFQRTFTQERTFRSLNRGYHGALKQHFDGQIRPSLGAHIKTYPVRHKLAGR